MSSRLTPPELIEKLERMERDVRELKERQFIGGASLVSYLWESAPADTYPSTYPYPFYGYDPTEYEYGVGLTGGATAELIITVETDEPAIVQMLMYMALNSTKVLENAIPPVNNGSIVMLVQKLPPNGNVNSWHITINSAGPGTDYAWFKHLFVATSKITSYSFSLDIL